MKRRSVCIRSHGSNYSLRKLEIVDATCPYVKKIHRIVEKQSAEGRKVMIIGSEDHPEVQGIKGWGDERTVVIEDMDDFLKLQLPENEKLCIVSQTTFNYKKFQDIVEKISKTRYDITVLNTICNATQERQVEAKEVASKVDAMIVIGGKNSSNTQKLYEICKKECENTHYYSDTGRFGS
ncbi:MAG: 4-hydroxy-3-methylbut-2-enyl diphosphate reductase [Clostridiaceae bacterium]